MDRKIREDFKACLHDNGLKITPERLLVLEEVYKSPNHFEADDLYFRLRKKKRRVSRATVYRTLELLVDNGFAAKVNVGVSQAHYENTLAQEHHGHLVCTQCGKIIEFKDRTIERQQRTICGDHEFLPTKHNMVIFGLCIDCRMEEN